MEMAAPLYWLISSLWTLLAIASQFHTYHIPSAVSNHSSTAQFTSAASGLDAPKIHPVNSSAFDWWYFDVVASDPNSLASVVAIFYTTTANAFPFFPPSDSVTFVQITGTFENGTTFGTIVNADGATVRSDDNASSGDWHNSGFSWTHTRDSAYTIVIDAPDIGRICGPSIGWANAVPDAVATVQLTVGGADLAFEGLGYHDKNWSDQIFTANLKSWYWGHGRLGTYSIVWFDFLALDGAEYVSAYASEHGKIIAASCVPTSIQVRPTGANSTYPPVRSTGNPSGYHITLDLSEAGKLEMDVSVTGIAMDNVLSEYTRAVGNITGTVVAVGGHNNRHAEAVLEGKALFEQFKMTD
ncbi:hypothetical protein B0H17DRAFT_1060712 [Mycena rosella]|uniref:Hydroxyneurosporene synthase n=1 Tax=Mycena rosella TaxID=1033263 RepID=A0AAD7DKN6_MYCRO|nr:hypothetical protein B0H17DRAFT_1060712 [Mycena rosella]